MVSISTSSSSVSSTLSPSPRKIQSSSLIDPVSHSPYLTQLLETDISKPVIDYIVDYVSHIVGQSVDHSDNPAIISFPMTRGRSQSRRHPRPAKAELHSTDATSFVKRVLRKARVTMSEVLATLAYIDRARPYLQVSSDSKYPFERVFLGALIVATKFLNDSCLPNMHWAQCTRLFGKHDVGRIEREFLEVLDWELRLTEDDLLAHYDSLILTAFPDAPDTTSESSNQHPSSLPACQEHPLIQETENQELSSWSSAHQRSRTSLPTSLPLIAHISSSSESPFSSSTGSLPSSLSPSTPDLELDTTHSSLDDDSYSSCTPPPLTPPSSLPLDAEGCKGSGSFWDNFFSSMRRQDASSPIIRFRERGDNRDRQ